MQHEDDVPEWIRDYACDVRDLFGLFEWKIFVQLKDTPGSLDGCDGACSPDTRYLKASIHLRRDLDDEQRIRHVIMHEMGHVLFGHVMQSVHRILDLVPDDQREHARTLYEDAEEMTLERLTRALQAGIR